MSLERSYRRLLRAYPAAWRREHEAEVLAVLLDAAEADGRRRPSAGDVADLLGHGLGARLGGRFDRGARGVAALLGTASSTALSLVVLLRGEWLQVEAPGGVGPFFTVGGPVLLALLAGPLLALLGRPRASRLVAAASLPVLLVLPVAAAVLDLRRPAVWTLAGLIAFGVLAVTAQVERRALLAGLSAALAAALLVAVWPATGPGFYYGYGPQPLLQAGPWVVALALAFAAGRRALLRPVALVSACWVGVLAVRARPLDDGYATVAVLAAVVLTLAALTWPSRRDPVAVRT